MLLQAAAKRKVGPGKKGKGSGGCYFGVRKQKRKQATFSQELCIFQITFNSFLKIVTLFQNACRYVVEVLYMEGTHLLPPFLLLPLPHYHHHPSSSLKMLCNVVVVWKVTMTIVKPSTATTGRRKDWLMQEEMCKLSVVSSSVIPYNFFVSSFLWRRTFLGEKHRDHHHFPCSQHDTLLARWQNALPHRTFITRTFIVQVKIATENWWVAACLP